MIMFIETLSITPPSVCFRTSLGILRVVPPGIIAATEAGQCEPRFNPGSASIEVAQPLGCKTAVVIWYHADEEREMGYNGRLEGFSASFVARDSLYVRSRHVPEVSSAGLVSRSPTISY